MGGMTHPSQIHYYTQIGDFVVGRQIYLYLYTAKSYNKYTTGTPYSPGGYYTKVIQDISTVAPWTTGRVMVITRAGTGTTVGFYQSITGYDNRTPNGYYGVISLVRPRLVHTYVVPNDPSLPIVKARSFGQILQHDIHIQPEPQRKSTPLNTNNQD